MLRCWERRILVLLSLVNVLVRGSKRFIHTPGGVLISLWGMIRASLQGLVLVNRITYILDRCELTIIIPCIL